MALALLLVAACGGGTLSSSEAPRAVGDAGGSDAPTTEPASSRLVAACPTSAPSNGSPCTTLVTCEYGTDPDFRCNTLATCDVSHTWYVTSPSCQHPTPTTDPGCPPQPPSTGAACATGGAVCDYAGERCGCIDDSTGGPRPDAGPPPTQWSCPGAPGAGCPATRPFNGEACSGPSTTCMYGAPCVEGSVMMTCENGAWVGDLPIPCGGG